MSQRGVWWDDGKQGRALSQIAFPLGVLQSSLVTRTEGLDKQVDWNW